MDVCVCECVCRACVCVCTPVDVVYADMIDGWMCVCVRCVCARVCVCGVDTGPRRPESAVWNAEPDLHRGAF